MSFWAQNGVMPKVGVVARQPSASRQLMGMDRVGVREIGGPGNHPQAIYLFYKRT